MMRRFSWMGIFVLAVGLTACGGDGTSNPRGADGTGGSAGMDGSGAMGGAAGMGPGVGMGGAAGVGGSSEPVSIGVCDNPDDAAAMAGAGDIQVIGGTCGSSSCLGSLGDPSAFASCVSTCIQDAVSGLSAACADCYGAVGGCGLANSCFACVSDSCSAGCLDCLAQGACLETLDVCTGIAADPCP